MRKKKLYREKIEAEKNEAPPAQPLNKSFFSLLNEEFFFDSSK